MLVERRDAAEGAEAEAERRPHEQSEPDQPQRDARSVGYERCDDDRHRSSAVLVASYPGEAGSFVVPADRARVHDRDVEREERVRHRDQLGVRVEAVADRQRVHGEEEHLREHERPMDRTVVAVAVRVERRRQPDQPRGGERGVDGTDAPDVRFEADGVAVGDHRGDEDQVVEQLQPTDRAGGLPRDHVVWRLQACDTRRSRGSEMGYRHAHPVGQRST